MTGSAPIGSELAGRIRVVILDADGVLTDGGIYVVHGEDGAFEARRFHVRDGVGLLMLRTAGLAVAIVSGKISEAVRQRARDLGIEEIHQVNPYEKLIAVRGVLERAGADWSDAAFIGDDLADLPVLQRVGLPCSVPGAAREVLEAADWVSSSSGGNGAVREFSEALLRARGEWQGLVNEYVEECQRRWDGVQGA
jgi:3-deoxy-D-manno-octulosonate 8-phosphate phosphatase (KDO 8-P phosphatase)